MYASQSLRSHGLDLRLQLLERLAQVADQADVDADVLVQLRRIDLDVDLLGIGRVRLDVAGDAVVEAHAEGEQQVGFLDRRVDPGLAVHAHHPEVERVTRRDRAEAEQRHRDRHVGLLGELEHRLARVRELDAAARQDDRALGRVDQLERLLDFTRARRVRRAIAAQLRLLGPLELARGLLAVLGDVDQHRAGPAGARHVEGLADDASDVLRAGHQVVVLGDRQRDAGDVGFLEGVRPDGLAAHLPGDADDRHRVHHRGRDAGDHVGRAGAAGRDRDPDLAGGTRKAIGHVRGALFMAHQDVADRVVEHRVVRRQDCAAGVTEHAGDAFAHQALPQDLGSGLLHMSTQVAAACRLQATDYRLTGSRAGIVLASVAAGRVIAPSEADDTRLAYLAMTPVVYRGAGGTYDASRRAISSSLTAICEAALLQVEGDDVAVADGGNRPAGHGFGGDVPGHQAARGAGEATVGQQGDRVAETRAHDRRGDAEHLAHARTALGAFVTNDDDVAGLDARRPGRRQRRLPRPRTPGPGPGARPAMSRRP